MESEAASAILGALGGAIVGGIVSIILWFANGHREDSIRRDERSHSDQVRKDQHQDALELLRTQQAHEDRVRVHERELERVEKLKSEARDYAKQLLQLTEDLKRRWDTDDSRGTYSSDREWTRGFELKSRLLPDAEFREFLLSTMRVINETWVVESVGELSESGTAVQRKLLTQLIDQLMRYSADTSWDRSLMPEIRSAQTTIDDAFAEHWENRM